MNKRVREIEIEAANYVNTVYLRLHQDDQFIWDFEFREKLIELMIKECVKVLSRPSKKRKHQHVEQILNNHFKFKMKDKYDE